MKYIFALLLLIPGVSTADNSAAGAIFVGAMIGGAIGAGYSGYLGKLPEELSDWADPATQSTSRLESKCGVLSEMKLVRTGTINYLFLGVRNESAVDVDLALDRIRVSFGDGRERIALTPGDLRTREVKKGWYTWGLVALPRKTDFKGQSDLTISVPVITDGEKTCEITSAFHRNKEVPEDPATYLEAPSTIASLGFTMLSPTGRIKDVYGAQSSFGMDVFFAGYRTPERGMYLDLSVGAFSDLNDPTYFDDATYNRGDIVDISLGWSFRKFHSDTVTCYLNVGPYLALPHGMNQDGSESQKRGTTRSAWGVYASYAVDYAYSNEYFGYWHGRHAIGLTFFAKYMPQFDSGSPRDGGILGVSFDLLRGGY